MTKLTIEDINKLIQVCDIATKTGGLQVAQETLPLAIKLQQMITELQDAEKESWAS